MSDQHRTGDDTTSSGQPAAAFFASPEPESPSPRGSASASASASGESSATGEATGKAAGSAAGESADSPDAATVEEHLTGKKTSASTTTTARASSSSSSSASATTDGHDEAEPEADPDPDPDPEAETEAETVSGKKAESEGRSEDSARSEESAPAPKARRGWGRVATVSGADGRPDGAAAAAAATTIGPGGDSPDADGGLSGRPKKPLLAGAAMAGAILVAVPLLIMATGKDDDDSKKVASSSSADTVLDDDGGRAGEFVAESPSPKKSKPEKKEKEKEKESPSPAKEKAADPSPPSSSPTAKEEEKKKTSVRKKAPSNLPAVLTRVLIKNNTNGTCVDVPGFTSGNPDGPIHQSACNSNPDDNQLWNVEKRYDSKGPGGVPLFQIRNVMDGMCLDLPGNGAAGNATKVTEFPCNGTTADNQLWWLDKQADGRFWIRNFASNNTCLDSYGPDDQTRDLIIWPCAPENLNNHEWYFTRS
ncbi:RICIN domain-containing protein [Streptomyces sp. NPDC021354]|uniref:RICIN domain-containing protein n=1 Tax=Streptomyces sp. NPDC021354 TaxID=3154793 RepID=UPI0033E204EA